MREQEISSRVWLSLWTSVIQKKVDHFLFHVCVLPILISYQYYSCIVVLKCSLYDLDELTSGFENSLCPCLLQVGRDRHLLGAVRYLWERFPVTYLRISWCLFLSSWARSMSSGWWWSTVVKTEATPLSRMLTGSEATCHYIGGHISSWCRAHRV